MEVVIGQKQEHRRGSRKPSNKRSAITRCYVNINSDNTLMNAEDYIALPKGYVDASSSRMLLVRNSLLENVSTLSTLPNMPRIKILCGRRGGLPFEYLMTDVISGCLPISRICYGNCTAADFWLNKGHNFGKRIINEFIPSDFCESVAALPDNQRWLRQGWASDCSFSQESWGIVADAAEILAGSRISLMIITKVWADPSREVLKRLATVNAEIRVSVSAFDTPYQLCARLSLLQSFRTLGGKSVAYLMSTNFLDKTLADNQRIIVEWIQANDMIASEHPLRFDSDNQILSLLGTNGYWHPKFPDQYWFGRLFSTVSNFIVPPPTCLLPDYTLPFRYASEATNCRIQGLDGNLPTTQELAKGIILRPDNLNKHATYEA